MNDFTAAEQAANTLAREHLRAHATTRRQVPKLTLPMPQERLLALSLALARYNDEAEKAGASDAEAAAFAAAQSVLVLGQMAEANDGE